MDLNDKVRYCGPEFRDGKLFVIFKPGQIYVNTDDCLARDALMQALNEAPPVEGGPALSVQARADIRMEFDDKIEDVRKRIAAHLGNSAISVNGNFEQVFAKLKEESGRKKTEIQQDWEKKIGSIARQYFEGFEWQLKGQKIDEDDMVREAFQEAVSKNEIAFRIVDKLTGKFGSYCECQIEDGVLFIQTTPARWGINCSDAAQKIIDVLE